MTLNCWGIRAYITCMRNLPVLALIAVLTVPQAQAEESQGRTLMEQGLELFFEGLRDEMEPALNDLRALADDFGPQMGAFLRQMGPALAGILEEVEDWSRYEVPEMLPNGDIIIRRKPDPEPEQDPEPPAGPTDI